MANTLAGALNYARLTVEAAEQNVSLNQWEGAVSC
jgi:predicted HicB family RNase H-like nuclease